MIKVKVILTKNVRFISITASLSPALTCLHAVGVLASH